MPDDDCLKELRAGDEEAWAKLHRDYFPRLWSTVNRIVNNPSLSDDVMQQVFIKAYREIGHFTGQAQVGTWLYRIAVNQALDTVRKQTRLSRWLSFFSPVAEEEGVALVPEVAVAPESSSGLERADLARQIENAMDELSPEHRAVVQLRLVDDCSLEETAKLLRCKEGTVNSRLHYACERLRAKLNNKIGKEA